MKYQNVELPEKECHFLMEIEKKMKFPVEPLELHGDFEESIQKNEFNFFHQNNHVVGLCFVAVCLKNFPNSIKNLTELKYLYVGYMNLSGLPESFSELKNLEIFIYESHNDVANRIEFFDTFIGMEKLRKISIDGYHYLYVPAELSQITSIEELSFKGCYLLSDKGELNKRLKDIDRLTLSDLSGLKNLTSLHLDYGPTDFPEWICLLKNLKSLRISYWNIDSKYRIKESVQFEKILKLTKLEELELNYCGLTSIPIEIGRLSNLKKLNLSNNFFKEIPSEISQCTKLEELTIGIGNHNLNFDFILSLPKIRYFDIYRRFSNLISDKIKTHIEKNSKNEEA